MLFFHPENVHRCKLPLAKSFFIERYALLLKNARTGCAVI
ncbi:hypothetical protein B4099_2194 [Heyndrickxia coagulans]|uniref:Uncharacterized protein n=1 Tax=Heyndrickxia coagulans TaxID=1398 RepID=A0A150JXD9_HEYCO|nr:hypothetical protein B4099_2194 [Heyndrickxia coagulans]